MQKNHPGLQMSAIHQAARERVVYGWGNIKLTSGRWDFNMFIPRSAPENGRPLCTTVKCNGKEVWTFESDHKMFQGLRQKFRVHLHELSVQGSRQFMLVEVLEGEPDKITRILRIDGDEFSLEVESLLKMTLGRLWGMKVHMKAEEKRALDRLMQPSKPK